MKNQSKSFFSAICILISMVASFNAKAQTPPCNTNAPVTYTLTETSPGEIYIPNASTRPWKGGDTLKIPAKTYSLIEISNFTGDACKKIVIINSGGQVVTTTWRMRNNSRYFKITGTGKAGVDYGFKINGGMMAISLAHDFEVDHVEATGGSLGFYFKTVPDASNPMTIYTPGSSSNYVMKNIYIHHNYMHDIHGEAMYIGHTGPSGDQEGTNLIPLRLDNVDISYNTVRNTDWDGIQLSNARNSKIYNNSVWNFGMINKGAQQAGIILGGNTTGEVYNNTISKGTGTGLQLFGYGLIKVYNNSIDSTGNDYSSTGQESFYANDNITGPEVNPKQQIQFYNNVVRNPMPKGAVRVTWYNNNSLAASITNNQYYIPNAASNWQTFHVVANPPGSILTNNVLIGSTTPAPNQAPVANAGTDKSIMLPANSVTLAGTGTDTDGSITGYAWTKLSGPAATIASATTGTTLITGMLQGTYSFELKVTDNAGATATDIVQVVVNPAVVPAPDPTPVLKPIKVNINGGTTYNNAQWNNWNTSAGLTSSAFKYDDGSISGVNAVLNSQAVMADNGTGYSSSATTAPSDVLRFNSASTSTRLLTISGLKPASKYNLEFYASRKSTGNRSVYTIGSATDTINTDNNVNDIAKFTAISPDNTGKVTVEISRIGSWNYLAGFMIAEQGTAPTVPSLVANAGSDISITLPVSTATLNGSGSGGTISSYAWSKVSGPAATLANTTSASLLLTALLQGTYTFKLTVTSSTGATASDNVNVTVDPAITVTSKSVNVNLNGGTGFSNGQWNNWNTSSTLTSAKFLYDDGTASNINAVLNSQAMMVDNGTGYATTSTNPPSSVLRFNSASTSTRTLTIKGLNPSKKYDLELFGSRKSTGNKTIFSAGSIRDTLSTDNNITDVARLNNVSPDNTGSIEILIERIGTWNYVAGFTIHEQGLIAKTNTPEIMSSISRSSVTEIRNAELAIYPSPFTNHVKVEMTDGKAGSYQITLTDAAGKELLNKSGIKGEANTIETFDTRTLKTGTYIIQVKTMNGTSVHTITKKIESTEL